MGHNISCLCFKRVKTEPLIDKTEDTFDTYATFSPKKQQLEDKTLKMTDEPKDKTPYHAGL